MNIRGIGAVFHRGRGVKALAETLQSGWRPPSLIRATPDSPPGPAYDVGADLLQDKAVMARLRRADRFSRMAALAAWDAVTDSQITFPDKSRVGIILATAFGPHVTTFRFLDDILQYGDPGVSPTTFSSSVHTAAASYIATLLDIRGPVSTVTDFHFAVHEALQLADAWLSQDICDHVIVGSADECGAVMQHIFGRMFHAPADGRMKPLTLVPGQGLPGEGSVFFVVDRSADTGGYADVVVRSPLTPGTAIPNAQVLILDAAGILPNESDYLRLAAGVSGLTAYSPLFGSIPTLSAFSVAAAALMLRGRQRFPCPVPENPHGLTRLDPADRSALDSICCARLNCYNRAGLVWLRQPRGQYERT